MAPTSKSEAERAREVAVRLLTVRARCRRELARALSQRNFAPEVIEQALDWLVERQWLDDAAYARAYVRGRISGGQAQGRARLLMDLRRKGVSDEVARAAVDEELGPEDDLAAALELARRRIRSMAGLDRATIYRRLGGFLQRRGFGSDVVRRALQAVVQGVGDE